MKEGERRKEKGEEREGREGFPPNYPCK